MMKVRESCFFCTSSFQFFGILGLVLERNEIADLYIDPQFAGAEDFAKRIRDLHVFLNVIVIDSKKIYGKYMSAGPGLKNHLQIANSYLHVNEIANMILLPGIKYNNIFLSSKAYLPRMVQFHYLQKKWDFNLFYFDDGAGTYDNNRAYRLKKSDKLLRKLLFGEESLKNDYKRFLFSPEVFEELNNNSFKNIGRINRFWEEKDGKEIINRIFNVPEDVSIKEKVIILDQPREELFNEQKNSYINGFYGYISQKYGYDNVALKKHPRSQAGLIGNIKLFEDKGMPFEIYCLNNDMSNKIIVTHSSTAATTPKILFNQEPTVLVLTKLIEPITGEKNLFADYFNAVRKSYGDPDRFFIPKDNEEINQVLTRI